MNRVANAVLVAGLAGCATQARHAADVPPRGHPRFSALASWSRDDFIHSTEGASSEASTSGDFYRFRIEGRDDSKVGFGAQGEALLSERNLFGTAIPTSGRDLDAFLYMHAFAGSGDSLSMPVRFGAFFHLYDLDTREGTGASWQTWGGRVAAEPEVRLLADPSFQLALFAEGGIGYGVSTVEVETPPRSFDTTTLTLGFEAGIRLVLRDVLLSASWLERRVEHAPTERTDGISLPGVETEFRGVAITCGVHF